MIDDNRSGTLDGARGDDGGPTPPVSVITGASRGIGLALAHEFAAAGHRLVLAARDSASLERESRKIGKIHGVEVYVQAADLATAEGCQGLADAISDAGLEVDYLVNNAGGGQCGPFHEAEREKLTALVDVNIGALTDLTSRFLPGMIARGRGGVLNVSSLGGFVPGPNQATYYASKAYVMSLTEALAQEVWGSGVKMAVLAPGPVATDFHKKADAEHGFYIRFMGALSAETVARIGFANFMCGQTIIVPGWTTMLSALSLRLAPHFISVPFTGWLLQQREPPGNG